MLAAYIRFLADDQGAAAGTLKLHASGLRHFLRSAGWQGEPGPIGKGSTAAQVLAAKVDAAKRNGSGRGQVDAFGWRQVERACAVAEADGTAAALRDVAVIRVQSDCMLRIGELAALQVGDVKLAGDATVTVRSSKTCAEPADQGIGPETVQAVRRWIEAAGIADQPDAPLFCRVRRGDHPQPAAPLSPDSMRRILKTRAQAAGVEGRISGHSARVAGAQELIAAGATTAEVAQVGRWRDDRMVAHYGRRQLAARSAMMRFRYGVGK